MMATATKHRRQWANLLLSLLTLQSLDALPAELSAFDKVLDDALARCARWLLVQQLHPLAGR
jgi:hypothetical protein